MQPTWPLKRPVVTLLHCSHTPRLIHLTYPSLPNIQTGLPLQGMRLHSRAAAPRVRGSPLRSGASGGGWVAAAAAAADVWLHFAAGWLGG